MWENAILLLMSISGIWCVEYPEYICTDGTVMKLGQVCNGAIDCADGSDEMKQLCYHIICPRNMFRCHYGACVPTSARCNGRADCADKSDESQCGRSKNSCSLHEFRCLSEECIALHKVCDGMMDCRDGSDESQNTCEEYPCPTDSYHCRHGGCIHLDTRCDGFPDCIDGSDESEVLCDNLRCAAGANCATNDQVTCPPIISPRISATCEVMTGKRQGRVPCQDPLPVTTVARYECKQFYRPAYRNHWNNTQMMCQPDGTWNRDVLKCEPDCGKLNTAAAPLVVNGNIANRGQWPWHATLYMLEGGNWTFWCGGSLISELVVVTAGHCVWKVSATTLRVTLGKYNSDFQRNEDYTQVRDVQRIIIQPSYQDQVGNYGSDIAVLVLNETLVFTSFIHPVCIDWDLQDIEAHLQHQAVGTVVGMGVTENETFSERLRVVQLPVVSNEQCMRQQTRDFKKYITYTSFCAGWQNGTGVCNGDSGGGLVFPKPDDASTWVLQGVVSVSPRKRGTSFCDPTFLTVFTKIGIYVKWLAAVLNTIHPERYKTTDTGPTLERV